MTRPATLGQINGWLGKLALLSPSKRLDGQAADATHHALVEQLAMWPADIVEGAILGRTWRWFPDWPELHAVIEPRAQLRAMAIHALEQERDRPPPSARPQISPERRRELIGESEAILAGMRDRAGMAPPRTETRRAARYGTDYWKRAADEAKRGEQTGNQEKKP